MLIASQQSLKGKLSEGFRKANFLVLLKVIDFNFHV